MRFIKGRILFVIFVVLCCSLLFMEQTAQILTDIYYGRTYDMNDRIIGEIYKASWNRNCDFVLRCKDFSILIRGTYLSEEFIEKVSISEYIELKIKPEIPDESGNFGEFDMRQYLAAKDINFVSYPKDNEILLIPEKSYPDVIHSLQFYGSKIRTYVEKSLMKNSDEDTASVCMSVMTGDGSLMDSDKKTVFQKAGLSHLMAVSGTHIAFVINPVKRLIGIIKSRYLGIKLKSIALVPFVFFTALVAGFTPSITRAMIMCTCTVFSVVFYRRYDPLNALGIAGILSIFMNPCCVFDTGFVLSYCACICIYVILPVLKNIRFCSAGKLKGVIDCILLSVAVNIGVLPLIINMFNGFSLLSIAVNIFASTLAEIIYIGSCVLTLAELLFLPGFVCVFLSFPITAVVSLLEKCASFSSGGVMGYREYPSIHIGIVLVYYIIVLFVLFCFAKKTYRMLVGEIALTGSLIMFVSLLSVPPKAEFLFFDVGQGISVLFSSRDGYKGLIDSGNGFTDIAELLKKQGVSTLDFIVVSHGHSDHYGGYFDVIDSIDCDIVFLPENRNDEKIAEIATVTENKGIDVVYIDGSTSIKVGSYTEMYLTCYKDKNNINDSSIVASFYGDWGSAVLPGDIEAESEQLYISEFDRKIDLLGVPHHGSDTSSGADFIETLSPKYAIISVGEDNIYGHPSPAVIDRIDDYTVSGTVYRTDEDGAVRFCFGNLFDFDGDDVFIWQKKKTAE